MADERRIAVVGGGIVGASIAFHLSSRGAQVTVIDAGSPGEGATSRTSFGWINARQKAPKAYHMLNRKSLDMWPGFAERLGVDVGIRWGGQLTWVDTPERAQRMSRPLSIQRKWGNPVRALTRDEMERLEPGIQPGDLSLACWSLADGHVDVPLVVRACLDRVTALGGTVLAQTRVTGFSKSRRGEVFAVQTESGRLSCDTAVLACGTDASAAGAMAGVEVPLNNEVGTTALTTPVPQILQHVAVVHVPTQLHLRQFSDGTVMLGFPRAGSDEEVARWFESAAAVFPGLADARIVEIRRAHRPIPQDGVSILGFTAACPNLYVASTHSGVTLAPVIGEQAAIEILDDVKVDILSPFRLDRFG